MIPSVTVVVRAYQAADTLPFAVASLLAQSVDDFECLIVDDGSTDATAGVVKRFDDPRVRYLRLPVNLGRAAARKVGLAEARGEFLGILDADDWWYPQKLERQLAVMKAQPGLALVSSALALTTETHELRAIEASEPGSARTIEFEPLRAPRPVPIPHGPSLFRLAAAREVAIDVGLARSEDFYFMLQLVLRHSSAIWNEPLYAYALPRSRRHRAHAESAQASRRVYAKYWRRHPVASLLRQGQCVLKSAAYELKSLVAEDGGPLRARGRPATSAETVSYRQAYTRVGQVHAGLRK